MCGIFFSVARNRPLSPDPETVLCLQQRGPDSFQERHIRWSRPDGDIYLTFISSVLALRGDHVQAQPLYDIDTGSLLCWNGEAWKIAGITFEGNDAAHVFKLLLQASAKPATKEDSDPVRRVLSCIAGPFAFVYYDATTTTVYYGRDRLGRRSLLLSATNEHDMTLFSASTTAQEKRGWELSSDGIHFLFSTESDSRMMGGQLAWQEPPTANERVMSVSTPGQVPQLATVDALLTHLNAATTLRVRDIPTISRSPAGSDSAKVAILFSGGLDCTLLARVVHDILPKDQPVDLRNIAFENPRAIAANPGQSSNPYECCPDRITGRSSFAELCAVCPERNWNLVAIDVPFSVSQKHKAMIQQLMYPHNTEMDLSIAMALYFAARGIRNDEADGDALDHGDKNMTSAPRVLLSGLGADELFAGYARHAQAFARGGYTELSAELKMDFDRIGQRNLGRDDRVTSHWGVEMRYPYLDEDFVSFALDLPVWEKCGFRPGKIIPKHYEVVGDVDRPDDLEPAKMLLRIALWQLGMPKAASERKRAIQFGAKTAKMEVGKGRVKGTQAIDANAG
jgi:asparagine synthetase B (glutamine-hydrolysing)